MEVKELIESVDIAEYIAQFVDLEENGEELWGLSPFKPEKTPSFSVRKESGSWYDFSSGLGGNLYTFVRLYHKCTGREAIEKIQQYAGFDGEITNAKNQTLTATRICKMFERPAQRAKESKTTILRDDYMERYERRDDKLAVWKNEGIGEESLEKFQVRYDSFSDRLVYPIRNRDGKIVNIGGRTLDPDWKEKKLRKYTYFHSWGTMDVIYGLSENLESIREKGEIILFEGCKSVLIADTWGICNTGAILTSHLNPNQLKLLIELGCRVVFALDKDVRIRDDHNIQKLKRYVNVDYLWDREDLLNEKDAPVDKGKEVFEKLYEQRLRYR